MDTQERIESIKEDIFLIDNQIREWETAKETLTELSDHYYFEKDDLDGIEKAINCLLNQINGGNETIGSYQKNIEEIEGE